MQARGVILARHDSLESEAAYKDAYHFAVSALKSNRPQSTASVCQKLLKMKPEDAEVHLLLGEAYVAMGDFYKAQARFTEATQLAPGSAKSWLSLAGIYRDTDQPAKQCEILQAASNVVTQDAQIFLALGEVYLRDDAPTRALNSFRTANELAKKNAQSTPKHIKSEAALALGNTLHQLGHDKDARLVLAEAYEADRDHMAIAHAYARVLLDTEAPERALPILDQTRKNVPEDELDIHLDYAKACLATKSNLDEIQETLNRILAAHPDHAEARVFLAEVLTESQDLEAAQEVYQEALSIVLQEDHPLSTRIALGLSKVYLGLNQPENAIATLKNVLQVNGEDLEVLKTLSTAYHAANLREKAIWAAKSVLEITPDSEDNLDWFIQQSIELGATHKAIEVLEKMFDQEDKQGSRLTKLGWLYLYDGDIQTARNKFTQIKTLDEVSPHDLYKSSQGLLTLEEANTAADFLEKAIQICKTSAEKDLLPKLYTSKIQAHQMNLDHNQALQTVDEAIALSPRNPALIQKKAEILLDLDSHQEAVACIESAIEKFPKNPNLKLQAAIIHRANGDLVAASNYAKQALKSFRTSEPEMLDTRVSAIIADLADAMLQTDAARDVLNETAVIQEHPLPGSIEYHCLRAELALDTGGEIEAVDALTDLLDERLNHPRVLALQSRLAAKKGDTQTASQIFQKALKSIGGFTPFRSHHAEEEGSEALSQTEHTAGTYIALAEAGLALKEWSVVAFLLKKAVALAPAEPRSHFKYARALVLRAEYQHLCETLNVTKHAPGESAKARYAFKEFEHGILQAAQLITKMTQSSQEEDLNDNGARDYISTWLARGQAAFQPSHEHAKALAKLPKTAENLTAQLAGFRHSGELEQASTLAQQIYGTMSQVKVHPYLLGQIALALAGKEPALAKDAIQTAIEVSRWKNMPDCAIFNAIAAVTAQKRHDLDLQVASLQEALEIWPDEPKWLSTAADLYLESDQTEKIQKSIQLLEQAAQLEPNQVEHYLKLSAAHQRLGNLKGAIVVLDQATRILPRQPEPWLALAKAHQAKGEIPQATRCAKALVQIDPDQPDGQLLLAEVSLEVDNAEKAADHIKEVLERHPDNPQALLLRAKTYMKLNDPKAALESLEKVLPKLPKSIPMQLQRIQLLQETKGASVALQSLSQLSEENPEDPRIYAALAELYSNLNDPKNAIQNAQLALKVEKEGLDKQEHISILTLLGRLLRKTGQLDQAIHYLNDAVEKGSEDPTSYIELGRCFQEQRLYDRALQYFEKAIEQAPEDSQSYYQAGLVLKETKEYRGAETMFKKAAKLAPKNMHIYRQLAAVTAINIVQNHQSKPEADSPISIDVPTESIEK
jgi:tetratricopeptide (TPR) repeat protein